MSTKRKVLAFTGIRSDYDLLSGLYRRIASDPEMQLGLVVAGAHLSSTYGETVRQIEADGLPILGCVENLLDSDRKSARASALGILIQAALPLVARFAPDIILYPGDREDVLAAAIISAYLGIPSVHFFGGDHTVDGNVDNPVRHATSKLSTAHFVAHPEHVQRLVRMGEDPARIHHVGSPALDKFMIEPWLEKEATVSAAGWADCPGPYAIMIQHPILGEEENAGKHFEMTLEALEAEGVPAFVSFPNVDAGNKRTLDIIAKHRANPRFRFFKNLDRSVFVNLLRHASFMIGNSSAGILEAPAIPLAAINVGSRQVGRFAAPNALFVPQDHADIRQAIKIARSDDFRAKLDKSTSPYGNGDSVERCLALLKSIDFAKMLRKTEDPLQVEWPNKGGS